MARVISLEDALAYVGVADDAPEATIVAGLLNAISDEVRRLSRRALEGEPTDYDQVIRIRKATEFSLPEVPVLYDPDAEEDPIDLTITPVLFDGTALDALESTAWRLEDADRGRIRIGARHEYVRVAWTTSGAIPDGLTQAVKEWLKDRFEGRDRARDLASYQTGEDAESYFATLAGKPPTSVGRNLGLVWHGEGAVI